MKKKLCFDYLSKLEQIQIKLNEINLNIKKDFENFRMYYISLKNKLEEWEKNYKSFFNELGNIDYNEEIWENLKNLNEKLRNLLIQFSEVINKKNDESKIKKDDDIKNSGIEFNTNIEMMEFTSEIDTKENVEKNIKIDVNSFLKLYERIIEFNDLKLKEYEQKTKTSKNDNEFVINKKDLQTNSYNNMLLNEEETDNKSKNKRKKIIITISIIIFVILVSILIVLKLKK